MIGARIFSICLYLISSVCTADLGASQKLEGLLTRVQTYQSPFVQTVYSEKGEVLQKIEGRFYLKKPEAFRWESLKPFKQILVGDGSELWIYDVDLEQVTIEPAEQILKSAPMAVLNDPSGLMKDFEISLNGEWFELFPRSEQGQEIFKRVEFKFSGDVIREMKIFDKLGQWSHIVFQESQLNVPISDELFRLSVPPGVDVIRRKE